MPVGGSGGPAPRRARAARGLKTAAGDTFHATCSWQRKYAVRLVDDVFAAEGALAAQLHGRRTLVVSTPTVWSLYGARMAALCRTIAADAPSLVLDVDERSKSIENVVRICESCQDARLGRTDALLALGGGVVSDLVTVAAALVRRGLPCVRVPTTLVGQIDAGIGIKGAVNFRGAKSYLGSFEPPQVTLVDPSFLSTAPPATTQDGVAEAVKIALIGDAYLFALLEKAAGTIRFGAADDVARTRSVLRHAIARMLEELAPNFFEDVTYRRRVDLGHTFSAMLESASRYSMTHGHAVAIDMALSASIAVTMKKLRHGDFDRILATLQAWSLPTWSPLLTIDLCEESLRAAAAHRGGAPNLVVPHAIGRCGFVTTLRQLDRSVLAEALQRLPRGQNEERASRVVGGGS